MTKAITIKVDDKALFKSILEGDLQDSINECTMALEQIEHQRKKLVGALWSDYHSMTHAMDFYWECKDSPFGWCAYDHWEDQAHDQCIFCGDPSERK